MRCTIASSASLMIAAASIMQIFTFVQPLQAQTGFSPEDLQALSEGRIIVRRTQRVERGQRMVGGTSFQVVNRAQNDVWRAVHDLSNYRYMLPSTRTTQIVARSPDSAVMRLEHVVGPVAAVYHLRMRFSEDNREVRFDLDASRPHDVEAARGFLIVRPFPGDPQRTVITWGALVSVGNGLFASLVEPQVHEWLLRVPETVRAYLEGRARRWYLGQT